MAKAKSLKKTLRLVADNNCPHCDGTGIKATNHYYSSSRKLEVEFEICSCVRVKPIGLYLPAKNPDVAITLSNE